MDATRFDRLTKLFASRRSRRQALAAGGGLAALGLSTAVAQEATPVASPVAEDGEGVPFMFVQTFGAGSLAPKEGEEGVLILTGDHLAGQTIYFSDRPERIVGMVATERFLGTGGDDEGLGFTPTDPPNAALVLPDGEVLVVELIDPTYDPVTGMVTYEVRVLADYEQMDLQLQQEPLTSDEATRDFQAASLFIDDCPDGNVYCIDGNGNNVAVFSSGFCYDEGYICCAPCASGFSYKYWANWCNNEYPQYCNGNCSAQWEEEWACGACADC